MKNFEKRYQKLVKERFRELHPENIKRLLSLTTYALKEDKERIIEDVTHGNNVFYILTGAVRGYFINEKGEEKNIFLRSEGYFGGDMKRIFFDEPPSYFFEAIGKTEVLIFDFHKFEELAFSDLNIAKYYTNVLKEIIDVLNFRIEIMIDLPAKERYLSLLKRSPGFLNRAYHKHVANFIGITPVSLSRIIKELKAEGKLPQSPSKRS